MKSYRKVDEKPKEITYPCLMECIAPMDTGMIVLFHEENCGIIVMEANVPVANHRLGHYSVCWDMEVFKPFTGTVVLEGGN